MKSAFKIGNWRTEMRKAVGRTGWKGFSYWKVRSEQRIEGLRETVRDMSKEECSGMTLMEE